MTARKARFLNIRPGYVAPDRTCAKCRHINIPSALECVKCTHTLRKPSKARAKPPPPLEHAEAKTFMQWVKLNEAANPELKWLFAVPNGGDRNVIVAAKMKAEGVKRGVPDYIWPVRAGQFIGLVIELKRQRGGKASDEQKTWLEHYLAQGWGAVLCNGADDAIRCVRNYLQMLRVKNPQALPE